MGGRASAEHARWARPPIGDKGRLTTQLTTMPRSTAGSLAFLYDHSDAAP